MHSVLMGLINVLCFLMIFLMVTFCYANCVDYFFDFVFFSLPLFFFPFSCASSDGSFRCVLESLTSFFLPPLHFNFNFHFHSQPLPTMTSISFSTIFV